MIYRNCIHPSLQLYTITQRLRKDIPESRRITTERMILLALVEAVGYHGHTASALKNTHLNCHWGSILSPNHYTLIMEEFSPPAHDKFKIKTKILTIGPIYYSRCEQSDLFSGAVNDFDYYDIYLRS